MFTDLGKKKGLVFFGVLAFLVVVIIILVCCLDFNGGPSTGAELLASVPFIVGKSEWSKLLENGSDKINGLVGEPWDIQGLTASSVNAQLYSVGASNCSQAQYKDAVAQTLGQIDLMIRVFEKYDSYFEPAISTSDIYSARLVSKIAGFLAVDGGYALDSRFSILRDYYRLGVRCVTLGGLCSTPWSTSSMDTAKGSTLLSSFGQRFIGEMNRLGILIDLTGSNEAIQLQTIELSRAPVIFTSSSSSNLTSNPMNVADVVLRALGAKGGLVMISFKAEQCCAVPDNCTVDNVVEHINHMADVAGKSSVGIGGDVGMSVVYPQGITSSSGYAAVFDRLLNGGAWTVAELQNLAGNNFLRIMENVQQVAKTMEQEGRFLPDETEISLDSFPKEDQGCYSQPSPQLLAQRSLPFKNAHMKFQHKMQSFLEVTSPATEGGATTPATAGGVTTPDPAGGVTTPSSSGGVTNPATEGGVTSPAPGGGVITPATAGGATTPDPAGGVTTPSSGGGVTTPAPGGGVTNPPPGINNLTSTEPGNTTPAPESSTTQQSSTGVVYKYFGCLSIIVPVVVSSWNSIYIRIFNG